MKKFSAKPAGVINSADLKTAKGQFVYWTIFLILCLICAVCILPAIWTLMTGFKTSQEMYQSTKFFPEHFNLSDSWGSIKSAWKAMDATKASLNTLLVCIGSTLFTLLIDGLGGYVLSRLKPKGTTLVFTLIVWTMMMPGQIRTVPLYMSYMSFPFVAKFPWELNLLNTYWPMIPM